MNFRQIMSDGVKLVLQVTAIVILLKSVAFAHNQIPSESMMPTLQVGDRLLADKTAYGWSRHSLVFDPGFSLTGENGRIWHAKPERGDIVTFTHPHKKETYIKRVIGLPGDRIALENGRLIINSNVVQRQLRHRYTYREFQGGIVTVTLYDEIFPEGGRHLIIERNDSSLGDNFREVVVPKGQFFVMGDNRDNSTDSRFSSMGFVPLENLQGKARIISYSLYSCADEEGLHCADRKFLSLLE